MQSIVPLSSTAPSTIAGIKRLAKAIAKASGIPHTQALDEAASQSGFQNYRHAQKHLSSTAPVLYITTYWRDPGISAGRETLCIPMPMTLEQMGRPRELLHDLYLSRFSLDAPDHLERVVDEVHVQLGAHLADLNNARLPKVAKRWIEQCQDVLDLWMRLEYPDLDVPKTPFRKTYSSHVPRSLSDKPMKLRAIRSTIELISAHYNDCAPKNRVLTALTKIEAKIDRMA